MILGLFGGYLIALFILLVGVTLLALVGAVVSGPLGRGGGARRDPFLRESPRPSFREKWSLVRVRDVFVVMTGVSFAIGVLLLVLAWGLLWGLCGASAAVLQDLGLLPFGLIAIAILFAAGAIWTHTRMSQRIEGPSVDRTPLRPVRSAARAPSLLLVGTLALMLVTVGAFLSLVLSAGSEQAACGSCGRTTSITAAITMTATTGGTCHDARGATFNTYGISIGGSTRTTTTADFGVALTQAGASQATPPGPASPPDNCERSPTLAGGWLAVLIAPGGSTELAVFALAGSGGGGGQGTWQPLNGTLPATIQGGQTMLIVAGTSVNLVQATVGVYGVPATSASCPSSGAFTGSVTL